VKKRILAVLAILGALLAVLGYGYKNRYAASIGIIGGADGPTAIFIAGKTGFVFYLGLALAMLALILLAAILIRKRK